MSYQFTTYQLGILWGCSTYAEGKIVLRNRNRYFLEQIQKTVLNKIYEQETKGKIQYVLKFASDIEVLNKIGYTSRNADIRIFPEWADMDFLQAYLEMHSTFSWQTSYNRNTKQKYYRLRYRIYGNEYLIYGINTMMKEFACELKSPQKVSGKTYYLSYADRNELLSIVDYYLQKERRCPGFWETPYRMMDEPKS